MTVAAGARDAGAVNPVYLNGGGRDSTKEITNLGKIDHLASFLAGIGIGITASLLLAPEAGGKTRNRLRNIAGRTGDFVKERAENLGDAAVGVLRERKLTWRQEQNERRRTMSDMKDKAKQKINDAADAAKRAAAHLVDKSKDVAHSAGKKMEEGGKRLQNA